MKRFIFCFLAFVLTTSVMAVDTKTTALSWKAWETARDEATLNDNTNNYDTAIKLYKEYIALANYLKRPDLEAWGYNNIGYLIIRKHMGDKTTDLLTAYEYLNNALSIKEINPECEKYVQSNLSYCRHFIQVKAKANITPEKKVVTPEVKK